MTSVETMYHPDNFKRSVMPEKGVEFPFEPAFSVQLNESDGTVNKRLT